jgi:hypothetical protein
VIESCCVVRTSGLNTNNNTNGVLGWAFWSVPLFSRSFANLTNNNDNVRGGITPKEPVAGSAFQGNNSFAISCSFVRKKLQKQRKWCESQLSDKNLFMILLEAECMYYESSLQHKMLRCRCAYRER